MSFKRMFETARYAGALSDLCRDRERTEIAIDLRTGFAATERV